MKIVMVVMLVLVVAALGSAGLFMLKRPKDGEGGEDRRMARALALRVGLSVALFLFVLLSWTMGWVRPGGLPTGH